MKIFKLLFPCRFNEPLCKDNLFGCRCGKGGEAPKPEKIDPVKQAQANVDAQVASIGPAAQASFDVRTNPIYGELAQTQLTRDVRQSVFPQQAEAQNQLIQQLMQNLEGPQGISEEQQGFQKQSRDRAQNELVEAIRTRQNLGSKLFGGRGQTQERRGVSELQQSFSEKDIARDAQQRQQAIANLMPILQLFNQQQVTQPNYINPVVSANQQYGGAIDQASQTAQLQSQQQAQQNQMQMALWNAMGQAAGGVTQLVGKEVG